MLSTSLDLVLDFFFFFILPSKPERKLKSFSSTPQSGGCYFLGLLISFALLFSYLSKPAVSLPAALLAFSSEVIDTASKKMLSFISFLAVVFFPTVASAHRGLYYSGELLTLLFGGFEVSLLTAKTLF